MTADSRDPVAPVWHTAVLLAVLAGLTILGWLAQRAAGPPTALHAPAPRLLPLQVQALVFEWATLTWVWLGVRLKGVRVRDLVGGRWPSGGAVLLDVALAAGVWLLYSGVSGAVSRLLRSGPEVIPYPGTAVETILAIAVALSAGVCEEAVFRGYLQRQFRAWTGSAAVAVLLQAAVFGVPHVYQGVRIAVLAGVYGVLFGAVALWRRSLRPGILAHAWSDVAARVLRI